MITAHAYARQMKARVAELEAEVKEARNESAVVRRAYMHEKNRAEAALRVLRTAGHENAADLLAAQAYRGAADLYTDKAALPSGAEGWWTVSGAPLALSEPSPAATLECNHCGGVAIESASGLFGEDDGDACMTCGMPGHVSVDEAYEDEDNTGYASWSDSNESGTYCKDPACEECAEMRVEDGATALACTEKTGETP